MWKKSTLYTNDDDFIVHFVVVRIDPIEAFSKSGPNVFQEGTVGITAVRPGEAGEFGYIDLTIRFDHSAAEEVCDLSWLSLWIAHS